MSGCRKRGSAMKLYELRREYVDLIRAIEEGEIPEEAIADTLEAVTLGLEEKADNMACVLKNIAADIEAFKAEEENLAARRKKAERVHERIKKYLSDELLRADVKKVETARNKLTFRKSTEVELDDCFMEWAMEHRDDLITFGKPTASKTKIKAAIESGAEITGARIVTKQNLQIG